MNAHAYEDKIRRICLFRAIKVARLIMSATLFVCYFLSRIVNYRHPAPLIIIFLMSAFTYIFDDAGIFRRPSPKKKESTDLLPALSKKYKYSVKRFRLNTAAFIFGCLLTVLWQFTSAAERYDYTAVFPTICLISGIVSYFVLALSMNVKMRHDLLLGKT